MCNGVGNGGMVRPGFGGGRMTRPGFPSRPNRPRPPGSNFGGGMYSPGFPSRPGNFTPRPGSGFGGNRPPGSNFGGGMYQPGFPSGGDQSAFSPVQRVMPPGWQDGDPIPGNPNPVAGGTPGGLRDDYGMPLTPGSAYIGAGGRPNLFGRPGAFRGLGFDQDTKRGIRQAYRQGDVQGARDMFREAGGRGFRQVRDIMDMNRAMNMAYRGSFGDPVLYNNDDYEYVPYDNEDQEHN